jgi:hypothetical protein
MKVITLFFLFLFVYNQLYAQEVRIDSIEIKRKIAYADGRIFKPTKQIRKAYRNHTLTNTSNYFNPTVQTVSNYRFLKDSVYVKSFKNAAYDNSVRNIKLNRTIIITGSIVITGLIALGILIAKALESFFVGFGNSII